MELPNNIDTGWVYGQFLVPVSSGTAPNAQVESVPAQGWVRFTKSVPYLPDITAEPNPVTLLSAEHIAVLDSEGYLCTAAPNNPSFPMYRGIELIATDDPDLLVEDWTWQVRYHFTQAPGTAGVESHSMALPAGAEIDLAKVMKVPSSPGLGTEQAEALVAQAEAAATEAALSASGASEIALQVRKDADAGLFDGRTGPPGEPGDIRLGKSASALFEVVDVLSRSTWLGARSLDGGPTDTAMRHFKDRLGVFQRPEPGILYAVLDSALRYTDIVLRSSDGQITDEVMDRWAVRIASRIGGGGGGGALASDRYVRGKEILPVSTDMTRMIGFGSSSMAGIGSYLAQGLNDAGWPVAFTNEGKNSEQSKQIYARMGAAPAKITVTGGSIPFSGDVAVTTDMPAHGLKTYSGTLAGVHGSLSSDGTVFTFTRTGTGPVTAVPASSPFIPEVGPQYRDAINLLWAGKNDPASDWQGTITRTDDAFDWLAPMMRRSLVLGHFVDRDDTVGSATYNKVANVNAAHKARYGNLYIDIRGYLSSPQLWTDTGITPTVTDLTAQTNGILPPSAAKDYGHLNAAGYTAVTDLIISHITSLGWYQGASS